jgi:cell division protein FtsI (penicillin-binding protein 3)
LETQHHPSFQPQNAKITVFFLLILALIFIFLGKMFFTVTDKRYTPSTQKSVTNKAKRGNIISNDGFVIASTQKLYKAIINTRNLDPDKKNLFVTLFSIYSGMKPQKISRKIAGANGRVVLSFSIDATKAKHLRSLAHQLLKLKVFKRYETKDKSIIFQGLDILESGETRTFAYNDLLTPIIGYIHKYEEDDYTRVNGIKGLEKSYQQLLETRKDGLKKGERDVNNYVILNKHSTLNPTLDGPSLILNIPVSLQRRAEFLLSKAKEKYGAKEIICSVMESRTGKVMLLGSSNRFDPKAIRKQDYPSLNANFIEYNFEPGSVIKPLVFARLLEHKKVTPFDIINAHNGRYKMGRKVITDDHAFDYLSAENVIVHSSNIGMAQMVQKIGAIELYQGLLDFGLTRKSGIDLPYEKSGSIPSITKLNNSLYKATVSYGYGLTANFMQLLKAYNTFNNDGQTVTPKIVSKILKQGKEYPINTAIQEQALDIVVANRVKKVLLKVVKDGTGKDAAYPGLEIGGKTGTAHIAEGGRYVRRYNSSFFGFANDKKHKYTLGVTVIEPNEHYYFAASSAVPIFKSLVKLLIEFDYLKPAS